MPRALLMLVILWLIAPPNAMAATEQDARQFVDSLGKQVLASINTQGLGEEEKQQRLRQMFVQYVDIPWMGRFVLGRYWQRATPDQQKRYMDAYQQYLLARYTSNFADYSGSKYTITDVQADGDGRFNVHMDIATPHQQQNTEAGYHLQATDNGQFKIRDIIIEGVSLIATQRSEFASVAQQQGVDGLIQDLINKSQAEKKS
ncbi:MAG: ABC transporter substrate-binding protein [Pseudomonadota bacterium]|nr:ABC transporter substrate-binding protein [Pseudomonadota bacterium]